MLARLRRAQLYQAVDEEVSGVIRVHPRHRT